MTRSRESKARVHEPPEAATSQPADEHSELTHDHYPKRRLLSERERLRSMARPQETPLAYLLRVMRDECVEPRRRLAAAVAAGPYVDLKPKNKDLHGSFCLDRLSDEDLEAYVKLGHKANGTAEQSS